METLVNFIRTQAPEAIEPLILAYEASDKDKTGEIDISDFCSILQFNISKLS
jgi:Ca2+-binding EF-hand superfamily protein